MVNVKEPAKYICGSPALVYVGNTIHMFKDKRFFINEVLQAMKKQSTNMITGLLAFYIIYSLFITGINTAWNWFLNFIITIRIGIQNHIEVILICLIVITLIIILKLIFMEEQTSSFTSAKELDNDHITEEEKKQKEPFERWSKTKQDLTLNQTQQMIKVMNEMLKSNRHRKKQESTYKKLLTLNGPGYVYFIKAPNQTTKIGLTHHDPFKRIIQIFGGVNTSYDVKVIHLIRTDQPVKIERDFHKHFEKKRYINPHDPTEKSEFFHLDHNDWEWIKRH